MTKNLLAITLAAVLACTAASAWGLTDDASASRPATADSSLYVKVQLAHPVKISKLKPGEMVEGSLSRDVYSADRKLFPAGSPVRLTVDHLEKRRRAANDHWPGVVKLLTPRHENFPVFKTATVGQGENERSLQVSMISFSWLRDVHAQAKKNKSSQPEDTHGAVEVSKTTQKKAPTPTLVLEATGFEHASAAAPENAEDAAEMDSTAPQMLPGGTRCRILLLGDVSASKSKPGDLVRARLLEPVMLNSKVALPAGSLFEGKVVKKTPPRWLSRSGSLYLAFTDLELPGGGRFAIAASLAGAELDRGSHTRIDSEGQLHGERPGKVWMVINLGVAGGLAKEADDTFQIIFEALVSSATDASTAGTARIISSCVSGIYMATRKGRDVVLPRFTEMDISLDRPVSLNAASRLDVSGVAAAGGK